VHGGICVARGSSFPQPPWSAICYLAVMCAPARPQSSKMSAPPAQTHPAQATAAVETATAEVTPGVAPVEVTAGQGNTPEANSTVTLSLPTPPNSRSVSVRDSYAEEQSVTTPQEMGPTGPIMTPTEGSAAARALASSFFTQFCVLLAVVLGLAAIIFTLSAGRKPMPKSQSARGRLSAASPGEHVLEPFAHTAASTDEHVLEPFAHTAASTDEYVLKPFAQTAASTDEHVLKPFAHRTASTDEYVPKPFAQTAASTDEHVLKPFAHRTASTDEYVLKAFAHTAASTDQHVLKPFAHTAVSTDEAGMAADWASSPPADTVAGIESTLQQLLRELEQLRNERACRGFEPTRKAVA
jgi:hypothetical protein